MKNVWEELPKPLVYLAPMSGVTNQAYRRTVKQFYADIVFPEFVSVNALHHQSEKTLEMLAYDESERPIIAQLFGSEPEYFYEAAQKILALGFDGVDINFGCPAPKIAKQGGGCALLGDLGRCREIIQTVVNAVEGQIPVSVKTRVSYRNVHVRDFCRVIADLPLANLCVHGRPFEKPYLGAADLDCIKEAKTLVPFLVTASGNAHTPEAAAYTLEYTGADGVALARGTFGTPWIGKQIRDYLLTGAYEEPTVAEKLAVMLEHARLVAQLHAGQPFMEMRKVLAWYVKGIPHAATFRQKLVRVSSIEEVESIVQEIETSLPSTPLQYSDQTE